jgi:ABC-2 type transport system permease protein
VRSCVTVAVGVDMWILLRKAYATQLHYLANFLLYLVIQGVTQLLTLFYLFTIFTYTDQLNGWSRDEVIFVFYLATMVILAAECFTCSLQEYYHKLTLGQLDPLLAMPVRQRSLQLFRWAEPGFLLPVLVLLCFWPWLDPLPDRSVMDWMSGAIALLLGVLAIVIIFALASLPALLTQRQAPADFMVSELSKMVFLPSGVFPRGGWKYALGVGLPLLFSANAAGAIFVKGDYDTAVALLMGVVVLGFVHSLLERRLLRNFSYPGS